MAPTDALLSNIHLWTKRTKPVQGFRQRGNIPGELKGGGGSHEQEYIVLWGKNTKNCDLSQVSRCLRHLAVYNFGESQVDNLLRGGEEKLRINSWINELCRLAVNHTFTWVGVICWVHLIPHSLLQLCGRAGSHCSPAANYWNNYTFLHGDSMTQLPLCTICSQVVDNSAGEGCERLKQIACPVWSNSSTWWLCSGGARWRQWLHHSVSLAFECH